MEKKKTSAWLQRYTADYFVTQRFRVKSDVRQCPEENTPLNLSFTLELQNMKRLKAPEEIIHQLHLRQNELEIQIEELRGKYIKLESSRKHYYELFDHAPVGYLLLNEKGIILEANQTMSMLVNTDQRKIYRQPLTRFILPEDLVIFYQFNKKLIHTGEPQECELRMIRRDGSCIWTHFKATLRKRTTTDSFTVHIAVHDISRPKQVELNLQQTHDSLEERVRERTAEIEQVNLELESEIASRQTTETCLRQSEERYRRITEGLTDYQYNVEVSNGKEIQTVFNPGCETLTGYTVEEFMKDPHLWTNIISSEDREKVRNAINKLLEMGISQQYEHRIQRKDGMVRWLCSTLLPYFDYSGNLLSYDGVLTDITKRKQAENAIIIANSRLTLLNTLLKESLQETDLRTFLARTLELLFTSPAHSLKTIGHIFIRDKNDHFTSWTHYDFKENNSGDSECPNFINCVCGEAVRLKKVIYTALSEDHCSYTGEAHGHYCVPIIYKSKIKGVLCFYLDPGHQFDVNEVDFLEAIASTLANIIDRKENEELLKASVEKERMHIQQLQQADKMASLGVLVSGVAHEINNPNNFIMLNTPLLRQTWEDVRAILDDYSNTYGDFKMGGIIYSRMSQKIPFLFDGIEKGSRRIQRIVADLKNYARQDHGSCDRTVEINQVVREATSLIGNMIAKHTDHFSFIPFPESVHLQGNSQKLEQVVLNLLQNSCEALKSRDAALEVRVTIKDETCIISIHDEGEGIPPENISKVMDPFFTTKQNTGGTGLGLSVSAGIIKDHGGTLEFRSEVGKGTVARILLPLVIKDD
jgi:PAS domain S-box-containing protein